MNKRSLKMHHSARHYAGHLLVAGLTAVGWRNWRVWRRESTPLAWPAQLAVHAYQSWPQRPRVSILVAAWNEAEAIDSHLQSFLNLRYPEREMLLCAGGDDDTLERASRYQQPGLTVLRQWPGEGKQRALRRCLELARGSVVMLTDADCVLADDSFERLIAPLARGEAKVVTGVSEPLHNQRANPLVQYQWLNDILWSQRMPHTVDGVLGRNCALQRSILLELGVLDETVQTGTDYFLSRRLTCAGYRIRAVPDSRIATEYPATARAYLRMWQRWNKNLLIHGLRFGAWRDVRGVASAAAIAGTVFLAPLAGPLGACVAVLLFATAASNRLRRVALGARLAGQVPVWRCILFLPLFTLLDMLAVLLAVRDTFVPGLRSRW